MIIRRFCNLIGLINSSDPAEKGNSKYFEFLLTPFTEPTELFGPWNVKTLRDLGHYKRESRNALQEASIVFLDEVFNGSSAIMNTLLGVMQEKILHDHSGRVRVSVKCVFGATNEVPSSLEHSAFFDRFLIRAETRRIHPDNVDELTKVGWKTTYQADSLPISEEKAKKFFNSMKGFHKAVDTLGDPLAGLDDDILERLKEIVHRAIATGASQMSNRRIVRMLRIMVAYRLFRLATAEKEYRSPIESNELSLIGRYFIDHFDDKSAMRDLEQIAKGVN